MTMSSGTVARPWIRRAVSVRPADLMTVARVLAWSMATRALLIARGFGGAARRLGLSPMADLEVEPGARPVIERRARRDLRIAVWVLDRRWVPVKCLTRSIVVQRLLARHGVGADLVIGCVTNEGFKAHAWVEVAGRTVGREPGRASWTPLARMRRTEAR